MIGDTHRALCGHGYPIEDCRDALTPEQRAVVDVAHRSPYDYALPAIDRPGPQFRQWAEGFAGYAAAQAMEQARGGAGVEDLSANSVLVERYRADWPAPAVAS